MRACPIFALSRRIEHFFGTQANSQLICLCDPAEAEEIASFRAGKENNNGQTAKHDFIPSTGAPAYLRPDNIVGPVAPAEFNGLKVNAATARWGPGLTPPGWRMPRHLRAGVTTRCRQPLARCVLDHRFGLYLAARADDVQHVGPHLIARSVRRVGDVEPAGCADRVGEFDSGAVAQTNSAVVIVPGPGLADHH